MEESAHRLRWTEGEKDFLRVHYRKPLPWLMDKLGRNECGIKRMRLKLRLLRPRVCKPPFGKWVSRERDALILSRKVPPATMAELFGVPPQKIWTRGHYLRKHGAPHAYSD